jgi:hypothetical protein
VLRDLDFDPDGRALLRSTGTPVGVRDWPMAALRQWMLEHEPMAAA